MSLGTDLLMAFKMLGELTPTNIAEAIKYYQFDVAKDMIKSGVDVNIKSDMDFTALHLACYFGYVELVTLLIDSGADINAIDSTGSTPILRAVYNNHVSNRFEVIKILIDARANLDVQNRYGQNVLTWTKCRDIELYNDIVLYLKVNNSI